MCECSSSSAIPRPKTHSDAYLSRRTSLYLGLGFLLLCFGCGGGSSSSGSGGTTTPAPAASLSPGTLTFPTQNIDSTSGTMPATLSNTGTASLSITSIGASGDFAETNNCPASLPAAGICTIQVTFKPTAAGARTGTLTVNDNSSTTSQTVALSGGGGTNAAFYVDPQNGNDSWSGTLAAANAASTDGPFKTFDKARLTVQGLNKTGLNQIVVQLRAGTYFLPTTESFTAADSGTVSMPIIYENYPGETPVISGGVRVVNWTNTSGNIWTTTLPASTQYFENLFYNGGRRLRPRVSGPLGGTPYLRVFSTVYLAASQTNCPVQDTTKLPGNSWECFDRFQYATGDPISSAWKNLAAPANPVNPNCDPANGSKAPPGDVELLIFEQFSTSKLRISCVDTTNRIVYLTGPTGISQTNASEEGFIPTNRYIVENVEDNLTQPGQWFLDRSVSPMKLTYLANSGENPNTDQVIIPQLAQVLVASNLQYVAFRGLTFEHDNYTVPASGHVSSELEPDIGAAVSFQNSQFITFDSDTVTHTSGTGLEFIPCINGSSPSYCVATNINAAVTNNLIENSAFYDLGVIGIRIGNQFQPADTDANVPQKITVQNNVVEGYGRTIPAAFGIGQGMGHDNLYTHNDVYDGYHCAISTSQSIAEMTMPAGIGNANNVISFNHVYNLLQGIMNDGGSIRIDGGNEVFTAAGNKVLNNKIHDVTDASIMDQNGYGGNGVYLDDSTGLVDVENNLIYRVSGFPIYTPHGPAALNEANTIKNNILAYGRSAMVAVNSPYKNPPFTTIPQSFVVTNNLFYFDRSVASTPNFYVQGGCTYTQGSAFTQYQMWNNNMYWRTDGKFTTAPNAFHVQPNASTGQAESPCDGLPADWTFYTFASWQTTVNEDVQSVVQDPGFKNPVYPGDDYTLPAGSPGVGFVVFDPSLDGRSNPVINPPSIPATFVIESYDPTTNLANF